MRPALSLPRVVGHRGAAAYAPENTLASFREARARGAAWVEFDVKLTADGVPILMHDDTLARTARVDRPVAATPWREIVGLDAGSWFGAQFAGEPIPSLEQAIACLLALGLGVNVEIKPCPGREAETALATMDTLRRHWPPAAPTPLISSFKDAALAAARDAAPEFPRAVLTGRVGEDWRARVDLAGAIGLNSDGKRLTAAQTAAVKAAGLTLSVYTIDDPALARTLVAMGVDCVISDAPDTVAAALAG